MKKLALILVVIFTVLVFLNPVVAQDKEYRAFGIGVNVLELSGIMYGNGATIYLPINLGPAFRLEPLLGFSSTSYDYEGDADDSETNTVLGLGIYPTIRRGSAVIYIGGRIVMGFGSEEDKDNNGDVYAEYSDFSFGIGPILGGEYYFNPHISLGGEMSIMFASTTNKTDYKDQFRSDEEDKFTRIATNSMIFIRFYF